MQNRPQTPTLRRTAARNLPYGAADGAVIPHAGRYARECVLLAFEMIGGVEKMADWARENPTEFYTRLYTKTITREVEVGASESVEDMLRRLDKAERTMSTQVALAATGASSPFTEDIYEAEIIEE